MYNSNIQTAANAAATCASFGGELPVITTEEGVLDINRFFEYAHGMLPVTSGRLTSMIVGGRTDTALHDYVDADQIREEGECLAEL